MHIYRDRIHGDQDIEDIQEIISIIRNNPAIFERLAEISQLSFINYVKEIQLSRLEHMIGTYIMAKKVASHIRNDVNVHETFSEDHIDLMLKHFVIAAFLHDIGHPPFSHIWPLKNKHELWSKKLINILHLDPNINKELLCQFILPTEEDRMNNPFVALLSAKETNELDVDRADYMQRDRICGMMTSMAVPDFNDIIERLTFQNDRFIIDQFDKERIEVYRTYSFKAAYHNDIFKVYTDCLKQGIKTLKLTIESSEDEFISWTDVTMFEKFKQYSHIFINCSTLTHIPQCTSELRKLLAHCKTPQPA
jgi:HD superfamily phosphohydrolase